MSTPIGSGGFSPISASFSHEPAHAAAGSDAPTVSTQAPISLTLPAPASESAALGAARDMAGGDVQEAAAAVRSSLAGSVTISSTPSRAAARTEALNDAASALQTSKDAGVDTSKRSFFAKLAGAIVGGVVVGLAAALTAVTAGAAAPLLAVACVNFAISVGDAGCAYNNLQHAKEVARGDNPPKHSLLPMGNSCAANLIHGTLTRCGVSDDTAASVAKWGGRAVTVGVAVAGVLVSGGATQASAALELAGVVTRSVGAGVKLGVAGAGALMDRSLAQDVARERAAAVERDPAGVMQADQVLATVAGERPPHEVAAGHADLVKTGLLGAIETARLTGLASIATTAGLGLVHTIFA